MSDPRPVITSVGTNSLPSLKKRTGRQNITPEQIGERFGLKPGGRAKSLSGNTSR